MESYDDDKNTDYYKMRIVQVIKEGKSLSPLYYKLGKGDLDNIFKCKIWIVALDAAFPIAIL